MRKGNVSLPYVIGKFKDHLQVKNVLLNHFTDIDLSVEIPEQKVMISNTDWYQDRWNKEKEWYQYFKPFLFNYLDSLITELRYDRYTLKEIWFQQYLYNSEHNWHVHDGCNFANVYYLEFSPNSPPTEFKDPITGKEFSIDVQEGDILTFPSSLIHRSPKNSIQDRKTIISWNLDIDIDPS